MHTPTQDALVYINSIWPFLYTHTFLNARATHVPPSPHLHTLLDLQHTHARTHTRTQDALAYIDSIRPEAEKWGICKVIPPEGWNPPSAWTGRSSPSTRAHSAQLNDHTHAYASQTHISTDTRARTHTHAQTHTHTHTQDALAYIDSIRPEAEKWGICKVIPPGGWNPPFCLDKKRFTFNTRTQHLNQLDAHCRIRQNFFDTLAQFHTLSGGSACEGVGCWGSV